MDVGVAPGFQQTEIDCGSSLILGFGPDFHNFVYCSVFPGLTSTVNLMGHTVFMKINPNKDRTKRETINGLHRGFFES